MTREQAEDLVWDLIQAYSDKLLYHSKPSYIEDFESLRERVINH